MDLTAILQILESTIRMSTPLLFACLAGLYSERAGVIDMGLEGKMLAAAFAGAAAAAVTGSAAAGVLAGIGAALILSAIHGLASITFRGNQLISGVAINFFASGLTIVLGASWFGQGGQTPALSEGRLAQTPLLDLFGIEDSPLLELFLGHGTLVYVALAAVPFTWWLLYRTRFGLRLRAVGENPAAVDTAGVSVAQLRYAAVGITAVLCGLAGVYMSMGLNTSFQREMTAGRGYIALAALIFAKWKPVPALGACLLFGFLDAISIRFQNIDLNGIGIPVVIPGQFTNALPFILTVIILAGFVGKAIPPRAGGEPYVKER
ncbi:ABC transporter permease [Rhodobacter sp. KR11]|uniref:ABC transporter permease n=1 Tax=Rhodobacter sp. KR11 TaxID=2974588 RepID=UPI002221889B|nr:ABC transporter permease [Rhodobacter sp. KR11]MCW1918489.1 ABC transporter permease [Rhodobacter sp. KR11]